MNQEGLGRLDFIQNVSFKFVELLSVPFNRSPDDLIRQQITYRYSSVKDRLAVMTGRLQEVVSVVKNKNPSLLLQLSGGSATAASASGGGGGGGGQGGKQLAGATSMMMGGGGGSGGAGAGATLGARR
jgi:uncharacterized membrane protein YgcG